MHPPSDTHDAASTQPTHVTITYARPDDSGLRALATRAYAHDFAGALRLRRHNENTVEAFASTKLDTLVSRRFAATMDCEDAVIRAQAATQHPDEHGVFTAVTCPAAWTGPLPPQEGFTLVEDLPVDTFLQLSRDNKQQTTSDKMPTSLLNQDVITVNNDATGTQATVANRMVLTLDAFGLLPKTTGTEGSKHYPPVVRVSVRGRWVRLDTVFASVYYNRGGHLLVL